MKVRYTEEALKDLNEIAAFLAETYPSIAPAVEQRMGAVIARIARWPKSARTCAGRSGVRVVSLGRYPYNIFYRVTESGVEILHVHHTAREPWA